MYRKLVLVKVCHHTVYHNNHEKFNVLFLQINLGFGPEGGIEFELNAPGMDTLKKTLSSDHKNGERDFTQWFESLQVKSRINFEMF